MKMNGHFAGVDTMSLTNVRRFDYESKVSSRNESAAIVGRKDINAIVSRWVKGNLLVPEWIAMDKLETAQRDYPHMDELKSEWKGSTYVTFEDAIRLQAMVHWQEGSTIKVSKQTHVNDEELSADVAYKEIHYVPKWCRYLTWVHPCNKHGARFSHFPTTNRHYDYRLLWIMTGIHTVIPELWDDCASRVTNNCEYNGWLLCYAMAKCYPEGANRSGKSNPFQYPLQVQKSEMKKEAFMMAKLMKEVSLCKKCVGLIKAC